MYIYLHFKSVELFYLLELLQRSVTIHGLQLYIEYAHISCCLLSIMGEWR